MAEPTVVSIDCYGTAQVDETAIERAITEVFDLTPGGIIAELDLARPIFEPTAYHGHFGRQPDEVGPGTFTWERTDCFDDQKAVLHASWRGMARGHGGVAPCCSGHRGPRLRLHR